MKCHVIWMGIKGLSLTQEEKTAIQKYEVSGLILFKRNIESLEQVFALCQEIKSLNPAPLIMIDREGGRVDRLSHLPDFPSWPEPAWLARHCSLSEIQQTAFYMALELKALGIGLNLAPVVDVPSVKSPLLKGRVWGDHPDQVSQKALAWIRGFSQAGVGLCAKHFPGHGGVKEDSHFKLPVDKRSLAELESYDLIPFQKVIEAEVELVMTAHIAYPAISIHNSLIPATLCPFLLKKVLRQKMGFQGLVVSDDLDMKALKWTGLSEGDIMKQALLAGVDILLKCEPPQDILAFLEELGAGITPHQNLWGQQHSPQKLFLQFLKKYSALQPVLEFKQLKQVLAPAHRWFETIS